MNTKYRSLWLLFFTFVVVICFASNNAKASDVPIQQMEPFVPAKLVGDKTYTCYSNVPIDLKSVSGVQPHDCLESAKSYSEYNIPPEDQYYYPTSYTTYDNWRLVPATSGSRIWVYVTSHKYNCGTNASTQQWQCSETTSESAKAWVDNPQPAEVYDCPPDAHPEYTIGPQSSPTDSSPKYCFPRFQLCPAGYMRYAVNGTCAKIQCPGAGEQVNNIMTRSFTESTSALPFGKAGTFCDGLCAYSVNESSMPYENSAYASGVSLGAVCGNKLRGSDDTKFVEGELDKNCQMHQLDDGGQYLSCNDTGLPDEGDPDTNTDVDLTDAKQPVEDLDAINGDPGDCSTVEDKLTCIGTQISDTVKEVENEREKRDIDRHNKLVEAQEEISRYVQQRQDERERARQSDALQQLEELRKISDGVSSGGGGGAAVGELKGALDGIEDGINETTVETDGEPSDGLSGFYEKEYPNGFQDVWDKNKAAFDQSAPIQYLEQWKVSVSGEAPSLNFCFNLGANMNYGCSEIAIDPRVFPFLRILILVCAGFLCRQIIFGG